MKRFDEFGAMDKLKITAANAEAGAMAENIIDYMRRASIPPNVWIITFEKVLAYIIWCSNYSEISEEAIDCIAANVRNYVKALIENDSKV